MQDRIEQKRAQRLKFLHRLYEVTDGALHTGVVMWELGAELGFSREETESVCDYLEGEGLADSIALGGTIGITHRGVVEVEEAISHPGEPTRYFPAAQVVFNVQSINNSQVQVGSHNTQTGAINSADVLADVRILVAEYKRQRETIAFATPADAIDADAEVEAIEAQLKKSSPRLSAIGDSLKSLKGLVSAIPPGVAGNMAYDLLKHLADLAQQFAQ